MLRKTAYNGFRRQKPSAASDMAATLCQEEWDGEIMRPLSRIRSVQPAESLTETQQEAIETACSHRQSLFIGGAAGWGKTETLLQIKDVMEARGHNVGLFSMGLKKNPSLGSGETCFRNALKIGLTNVHWFWESQGNPITLQNRLAKSHKEFLKKFDILLLDDMEQADHDVWRSLRISLTNMTLSNVDHTYTGTPFNGLQIVAAGDFLAAEQGSFQRLQSGNHAFDDVAWDQTFSHHIELKGKNSDCISFVHDEDYSRMLTRIRNGSPTDQDLQNLKDRIIIAPNPLTDVKCDPLQGYFAPIPSVNTKNLIQVNYDRQQLSPDPKNYNTTMRKMNHIPDKCKVYQSYYGAPNGLDERDVGTFHDTSAYIRETLKQELLRYGLQAPERSKMGYFMRPPVQVFAKGEEVTFLEDVAPICYAGMRGKIVDFTADTIIVKVNSNNQHVYVKRVTKTVTANPGLMEFGKQKTQSAQNIKKLASMPMEYSATFSFMPLAHVKADISENLYANPFINGLESGDSSPHIILDMNLTWTGSLRSLYSVLAHAPSLDKIHLCYPENGTGDYAQPVTDQLGMELPEVVSLGSALFESRVKTKDLCYLPAKVFHQKGIVDLGEEACPVCGEKLSAECPMSEQDSVVSRLPPALKLRHCTVNYDCCEVTNKVMTHSDFVQHSSNMSFVRCECGEEVRHKDIMDHRSKYVIGTVCYGSLGSGLSNHISEMNKRANPESEKEGGKKKKKRN
eukprot:TRINITY_DN4844_c0_g1_i1.p1 TRINITY_DN4844_c0_g1~~TRINITY_DN4844_c0_g1_i1.p1  ORF type:complete len:758 (+),score=69.67 TRINITY_DN4844_c0_g1_i1:67-2274(+)